MSAPRATRSPATLDRAIDAAHKWRAVTASYTMDGMTDGEIALVNLLLVDAILRAREIEDEYQPAYGVTVSSADDGVTYCTIIDGVAE